MTSSDTAERIADRAGACLSGSVTCVLRKDGQVLVSEKSGIAPMMDWIAQGLDLKGYRVEDKIVGKAAAMLFVKAGIAEVYAEVLSEAGKAYLEAHGIPATYGKMTEKIINRTGDGMCPMEQTVLNIEDAEEGYAALKQKLAILRSAK